MHDDSIETSEREALAPAPKAADTFIQPKITGYRQLSQVEADLMNEAKALGAAAEDLIARLRIHHEKQRNAARGATSDTCNDRELQRIDNAEPARWLAMGRTDIQIGVMKIVRSIAQPAS